jgi:hypothetical protein
VKHELRDSDITQYLTPFRKGSGSGDVGCVEVALVVVDRD